MASLFFYRNRYYVGYYDKDIQRNRKKSLRTADKTEARKRFKRFEAELELGLRSKRVQVVKMLSLSEAFEMFFKHRELSPKSRRIYELSFNHLLAAVGDVQVCRLSTTDHLKFIAYLNDRIYTNKFSGTTKGLSINSKATYTRHIYAFAQFLVHHDLLKRNVFEKTKSVTREPRIIPRDILDMIFFDMFLTDVRNYDVIKIIYLAALRASEITTMQGEDINFKSRTLVVRNSKGKRTDTIPLSNDLAIHLQDMNVPKTGLLFPELTYSAIRQFWERTMKRLKISYKTHSLRKTRGTELAERGYLPFRLKQYMRHSSIVTTEKYYVNVDLEKARASLDGLPELE